MSTVPDEPALWKTLRAAFDALPADYERERRELPQRLLAERSALIADVAKLGARVAGLQAQLDVVERQRDEAQNQRDLGAQQEVDRLTFGLTVLAAQHEYRAAELALAMSSVRGLKAAIHRGFAAELRELLGVHASSPLAGAINRTGEAS